MPDRRRHTAGLAADMNGGRPWCGRVRTDLRSGNTPSDPTRNAVYWICLPIKIIAETSAIGYITRKIPRSRSFENRKSDRARLGFDRAALRHDQRLRVIALPRKTIAFFADAAAALDGGAKIVAAANVLRGARRVCEKDVDADSEFFGKNDSENGSFSFSRFVPNIILQNATIKRRVFTEVQTSIARESTRVADAWIWTVLKERVVERRTRSGA